MMFARNFFATGILFYATVRLPLAAQYQVRGQFPASSRDRIHFSTQEGEP
jgi:hypothetical protein